MIGSERQTIWSTHISIFQIFITQTFERLFQWYSILLENEIFENSENQPKWSASLFVLNKLILKNWCNQNLRLVEPIVMVYFLFFWKPCFRGVIENDPKNFEDIFKDFQDI